MLALLEPHRDGPSQVVIEMYIDKAAILLDQILDLDLLVRDVLSDNEAYRSSIQTSFTSATLCTIIAIFALNTS